MTNKLLEMEYINRVPQENDRRVILLDITHSGVSLLKEAVEKFKQTIPVRRVAQPEEVSHMIIFLASDEARYSTGSEFVIDGGVTSTV
ncbi:SDR family oxidoreductase [Macrococcus sp. 18KM445]|uniref:SDR family oxidoreductase n=2 Tax=Macrococcus equi TaxID=3395462 RepID=UPI0039BE604A